MLYTWPVPIGLTWYSHFELIHFCLVMKACDFVVWEIMKLHEPGNLFVENEENVISKPLI